MDGERSLTGTRSASFGFVTCQMLQTIQASSWGARPTPPSPLRRLGILLEQARRPAEALEQHREAARLEPRSPRFLNNLGFALLVRGRAREAVPVLEDALRIAPGDARLRNNLGFALAAANDFGRAARQFELGGTRAEARNNLGLAYELAGNLPQAYDQYLEAVRLEPGAEGARANLEHVARELGRTPPAIAPGAPRASEIGGG